MASTSDQTYTKEQIMEYLKEGKPWLIQFAQLAIKSRDRPQFCTRDEFSSHLMHMDSYAHANSTQVRDLVFACLEELGDGYVVEDTHPVEVLPGYRPGSGLSAHCHLGDHDDSDGEFEDAEKRELAEAERQSSEVENEFYLQAQEENYLQLQKEVVELKTAKKQALVIKARPAALFIDADSTFDNLAKDEDGSETDSDSDDSGGYYSCEEEDESAFEVANEYSSSTGSEGK